MPRHGPRDGKGLRAAVAWCGGRGGRAPRTASERGYRDAQGISCITLGTVMGMLRYLVCCPRAAMGMLRVSWTGMATGRLGCPMRHLGVAGEMLQASRASPQAWSWGCRDISCVSQAQPWGRSGHLMRWLGTAMGMLGCPVCHLAPHPRHGCAGVRTSCVSPKHSYGDALGISCVALCTIVETSGYLVCCPGAAVGMLGHPLHHTGMATGMSRCLVHHPTMAMGY